MMHRCVPREADCKALAKRADIAWETFPILLVQHAFAFGPGHHDNLIYFLRSLNTCLCNGQTDEHCACQANFSDVCQTMLSVDKENMLIK